MLYIEQLTKCFGKTVAVDGVSLHIKPGEVYSLIGPNGSGKTTIVKTVAGLLKVDNGTVRVVDADVTKDPIAAKRSIGYIPDDPVVWPGMTGEEFLHFSGALYDVAASVRTERIPELLAMFHLGGMETSVFESYSRGNKQKFSILAALLHKPALLLVDEPIVGLDPESARTAKKLFSEFAKSGGAVLLVTHTLPVAEEISTRVGFLKNGKLLAEGTMAELRDQAKADGKASLESLYEQFASR